MTEPTTTLWLRWSWRDLRKRWLLVLAIALIIAVGTGANAGLGSTAAWRRQSNDESFALLAMHDLRVSLAQGATLDAGALDAAARSIPHAAELAATEERLVGVTEVDASSGGDTVLVPGELVGLDVGAGELSVDRVHVFDGRSLTQADDGQPVGVLEHQFADHYHLPPTGAVRLSGGTVLSYVGVGTSPQHFIVTSRSMSVFAQAGLAVLFVPLSTAQELLGQPDQVNEIALTLVPGADRDLVQAELQAALDTLASGADGGTSGATITVREDEPAYRMLYEDIEGDQQFWNIIAALIFAGATFAAFNLITRIVEAQRREIGIGMALGLRSRRLAIRPVLIGVQIAVAGAIGGLAVGLLLDVWLQSVFQSVLPLPVFRAPFQPGVFARAAAVGFALPLVATIIPVWRAVRVEPVDAIRAGHLAARRGAGRSRMSWLRLPGRSYWRMPFRNLVRTPRRTALTALAIGAAITTMVFTIGLIDSFVRTMDDTEAELTHGAPARTAVELETFLPVAAPEVAAIAASPLVATAEPGLRLFGSIDARDQQVDLIIDLLDFRTAGWTPTVSEGSVDAVLDGGLVLSRKAADDLDVRVGETVRLHHPERVGFTYRMVDTDVPVAAIHPSPMRFTAYFDLSRAALFGMQGITNLVQITPAAGVTDEELLRGVFALPGVGSVQSVTAASKLFKDALAEYFGILRVAELLVLVLALLIAFNATSISVDERSREHATMQAFGLRPRSVLALVTVETVVVGVLGTIMGVAAGRGLLGWMTDSQMDQTVPDVGVIPYVSPATLVTAVALGVGAVAIAPIFTARRVSRVDIPSTLRVIE